MNAKSGDSKQAQLSTIYCVKNLCKINGFHTVESYDVKKVQKSCTSYKRGSYIPELSWKTSMA